MTSTNQTEKAGRKPELRIYKKSSDQVDSEIGEALAEMLDLKVSNNGLVSTFRGRKSFIGLTRSIESLISDIRAHAEVCDSNLM